MPSSRKLHSMLLQIAFGEKVRKKMLKRRHILKSLKLPPFVLKLEQNLNDFLPKPSYLYPNFD